MIKVFIDKIGRVHDDMLPREQPNGVALTYDELESLARRAWEAGRETDPANWYTQDSFEDFWQQVKGEVKGDYKG